MKALSILFALLVVISIGCSRGGGNPSTPSIDQNPPVERTTVQNNRILLNVGEVNISADRQTVEVIPNRDLAMHLNILPFIEKCAGCIWFSDFVIYSDTEFSCDVKLKHPLPNLPQYTIFDMRFIFITDADYTFPGCHKKISFNGNNPRILNPSGFTTLFNPTDFPYDPQAPIFTYFPGFASFGDDFSATLNPYVAFGLENPRRMIESGEEVHRRVALNVPSGPLKFGYAVDACWVEVTQWDDPVNDFPPKANCNEAYQVNASMDSWPGLGDAEPINVIVFDHQGVSTISKVTAEAPGLFNGIIELTQSSGAGNSAEYGGIISNDLGGSVDSSRILIRVVDTEVDEFSGQVDAWQIYSGSILEQEGNLIWAKRIGGPSSEYSYGITTLSDNSTVIVGDFYGSVTFGPGEPNQTVLISHGYYEDIYTARYNPDGTLVWAKSAGGESYEAIHGVTALSDNSTVETGWFAGSATFGSGESHQTILTSAGGEDIFIARYNANGTLAWAKRAGGTSSGEIGHGITTTSDNSIVVTGEFGGSATFGSGEPNQTVLTSGFGCWDIFIARYNPDGTLAWAKRAGGTDWAEGYGITALSDNSTVATGWFSESTTFGPGEANQTVLTSAGEMDIFIARYNPNGTLAWAKRAGGASYYDCGYGIATLSDNSTVVTGSFVGSATFGFGESNQTVLTSAGSQDIFIAHYNANGTLAWVKRAGGASGNDDGFGITALSDDTTVVTGGFSGSATFGPGDLNQTVLTSAGYTDIFTARYNPDGTVGWAKRAGGTHSDNWCTESGYGITTLSDNSTVVTGRFQASATFGPGEPNQTVLTSAGDWDIFIARFNP